VKSRVLAVIPARMGSSRFPGKPLASIGGKSLIERLYTELSRANRIDQVAVATDSDEIIRAVRNFGGAVVRTSKKHRTGSDRTAEAAQKLGGAIIINIQADNLGLKAREFDRVIEAMLADNSIKYATFAKRVESEDALYDPNRVKVVEDIRGNALWFTRYPVPFLQGINGNRLGGFPYLYHIGVYFYRRGALKEFTSWPRTPLEKAESLEQLRILENGGSIKLFKTKSKIYSIDTPEDLVRLENIKS